MLAILITLCVSANPIEGGWETIPVNSEQVKTVKPYLDRNLPHLFPEITEGHYKIASAKLQIVNGMNLKLIIKQKLTPLKFEISLYVDHENKITLNDITHFLGTRPTIGGFNWEDPTSIKQEDLDNLIVTIQKKVNLLVKTPGKVIVYRKQVVNGLKKHVIFRDANQNIFSVLTIRKPNDKTDDLISVYQIY